MSYYTTRMRTLTGDPGQDAVAWPAPLELTAVLSPAELFQQPEPDAPRVVISGPTDITLDGLSGKLLAKPNQTLPSIHLHRSTPVGELTIDGNTATVRAIARSFDDVGACVDYLCINLAQYITLEIGLFVEAVSIAGSLGGNSIAALYPGGSYALRLVNLPGRHREAAIDRALGGPARPSASFPRFAISCFYYHHALRLMSPHEVSFAPYVAHAEVMLNLAKSLEILLATDSHDTLRERFQSLGYTPRQIESQLIPIFLMRNDADVAHPTATRAPQDHIIVYRSYIDRAIGNVGAVIRQAAQRIRDQDDFLSPLSSTLDRSRAKFVARLQEHLQEPALDGPYPEPESVTKP